MHPDAQTQFTRVELKNGLLVLLKEIHTAPIVSHWIWYRVGSKDEVPGKTGISHWVEHMQFKGSARFSPGELDKAISRVGGYWNAMTSNDWTTYYETLPSQEIDLALQLEADRMTNSLFEAEDVASERTVIISERQGHENNPFFLLSEEVQAAAFRVHPYHHEVIGDMADLETIQRDELFEHYRSYYVPGNAVLAVAGDFHTQDMLEKIHGQYESIPAGELPPRVVRPEPPQRGERRVVVEGPGETTFVQVAYRAPAAAHPDFFPLTVLTSLLTGPSSLNMFGSSLSNKTSRLYRALVEEDLAVAVSGGLQASLNPYLYQIILIAHPLREIEEAVVAMDMEIEKLRDQPPSTRELERAVKQARALFAYGSESITNQAYWLGFTEMFADYQWFMDYLVQLEDVTPQDVQRVAQIYLRPQNRVLGTYHPVAETGKKSL